MGRKKCHEGNADQIKPIFDKHFEDVIYDDKDIRLFDQRSQSRESRRRIFKYAADPDSPVRSVGKFF